METPQARVFHFHEVFGLPHPELPDINSFAQVRIDLIREELKELEDAWQAGDLNEMIDALADLDYVVNGAAVALGVDLEDFSKAVHYNNMTKICKECGKPHYREDGKVLKPEGYQKVDLKEVFVNVYGG